MANKETQQMEMNKDEKKMNQCQKSYDCLSILLSPEYHLCGRIMIFETTHHEKKGRILYEVGNKGELSHKPCITMQLICQVWHPSLLASLSFVQKIPNNFFVTCIEKSFLT